MIMLSASVALLLLRLVLSTVEDDIAEAGRLVSAVDRVVEGATAALRSIEANALPGETTPVAALCRLVLPHHVASSTFSIDAASTACSVDGAARALRVAFDIVESDAETACNDALHHERLWNPPPQPGFEVQLFNETAFDSALTAAGTVQIGECRTATTRHFRVEFALPLIDISARETTYAVEALLSVAPHAGARLLGLALLGGLAERAGAALFRPHTLEAKQIPERGDAQRSGRCVSTFVLPRH